jgi:hypothetical protein
LTFIGGATASLHASRMRETRERQMSLAWVHGRLEIDFLARRFDNATPLQLDRDYAGKIPDPLGAWVSAFLAAVRGEGPAPMDPVDAARAVAVVAEIDRCAV